MRKIKFRAWNEITKTMIDLNKITPLALNMDTDGLFIPFCGMPLMQFTGLQDKNEIDIYEGDIVEWWADLGTKNYSSEVIFIHGAFLVNQNGMQARMIGFVPDIKIIGNIHQNHELLKT